MTPRLRHGPAGLLMALLLVAGLTFSYGLGHAPPLRVCTAHATSVPAGVADAMAAHALEHGLAQGVQRDIARGIPDGGLSFGSPSYSAPVDLPPLSPADVCLCLAVLFGLLALSLAAKPRRTGGRRLPRSSWGLSPPAFRSPFSLSLSCLQVLRL